MKINHKFLWKYVGIDNNMTQNKSLLDKLMMIILKLKDTTMLKKVI